MSREINPFGLRMPSELRAQIEAACAESGGSMNSEIVRRLQESMAEIHRRDLLRSQLEDINNTMSKLWTEITELRTVLKADRQLVRALASMTKELAEADPGDASDLREKARNFGSAYLAYGVTEVAS